MKTSKKTAPARQLALAALLGLILNTSTQAVILKGSGDPNVNTTPPAGALQDSGWQYQGQWGDFLGTVIGPSHFIAARHVGGAVGQAFNFQGVSYQTTAYWDDPGGSDLRIWRVDGVFPLWAPLYSSSDELGKSFVVIGRGTQRGEPVVLSVTQTNYATNVVSLKSLGLNKREAQKAFPDATFKGTQMTVVSRQVTTSPVLKGWKAGTSDNVMRWGENQVTGASALLSASFDTLAGDCEAYLSAGDSSGAVFIQEGGVWKLAGINFGVQGPFSFGPSDPGFYGAILDKSGLYAGGMQVPNDGTIRPVYFYATRISGRLSWINTILSQ